MHLDIPLLEIIVVMIMTSIMATIGINSWRELQARNELSSVTLALIEFLNDVKTQANSYNANMNIYYIETDFEHWCLAVSEHNTPTDCQTKFRFIPKHNQVKLLGFSINSPLTFYGRTNSAQAITLHLRHAIGESRIIITLLGRIRYCSYQTYLSGFSQC